LPNKNAMVEGDVLLGLASNGPHSNGYSLIRKIVKRAGLSFHDAAPWRKAETVGASLLMPTKIYVKPLLAAAEKGLVKGMAHITGGGLLENIPRMLPDHLSADVNAQTWPVPEVFRWLKSSGKIEDLEFARVWNTGLGMILVVERNKASEAIKVLEDTGESVYEVGTLVKRTGEGCVVKNMTVWS